MLPVSKKKRDLVFSFLESRELEKDENDPFI